MILIGVKSATGSNATFWIAGAMTSCGEAAISSV